MLRLALAVFLATISCARAAYVGPGDITAYTAWWGLRAYSAAVAATGTQPAMDLRRASDSATCTALIATDGTLDLTVGTPCNGGTQTVTAWIGGSSAAVSKLYDQTGGSGCGGASCDLLQATAGNQPTLFLTGGGGGALPYIQVLAQIAGQVEGANNFTPNASRLLSISAVANRTVGTNTMRIVTPHADASDNIATVAPNTWSSNVTASVSDASWHVANVARTAVVSATVLNVDGIEHSGTATVSATPGHPIVLDTLAEMGGLALGEAGFADNVQWSRATRMALCVNQGTYWGIAVFCTGAGSARRGGLIMRAPLSHW